MPDAPAPGLSFIVPVLNDREALSRAIEDLTPWSQRHEVILVDGGSSDGSLELAQASPFICITTSPGRAVQMNSGAAIATGDTLVFLHCDTRLPANAPKDITHSLSKSPWGHFDIHFTPNPPLQTLIAWSMNRRARITRIATGDQTLFFRRSFFSRLGGFASIPLMEDVEICRRARLLSRPVVIATPATTSSRRWLDKGTLRTVLHMWSLRLRYWLGEHPDSLHQSYYEGKHQ
ncbi:MAG: TIGR04283 family arsenosugar biosynthesis glycosyltransferase [Pseudomonadota bacterium]